MPIILAIEPDRRQAAHLAGVVRHRVAAELIIADTTEGALDAIGNRVPDMVLVPALLSPQDDAALAAALRVIAAAAHVRTLTIPVLANSTRGTTPGGMLAKWRRGRAASPEPEGCDPAVFAEQINAYLKEAAAERAELEHEPAETDVFDPALREIAPMQYAKPVALAPRAEIEPTMIEPPAVERLAVAPPAFEPPMVEPLIAEFSSVEPLSAEPLIVASSIVEPLLVDPPIVESFIEEPLLVEPLSAEALQVQPETIEAAMVEPAIDESWMDESETDDSIEPQAAQSADPWALDVFDEPVFDLSEALEDISKGADKGLFAGESSDVYTIQSVVDDPDLEEFELPPTVLDPIDAHVQSVDAYAAPQPVVVFAAQQPVDAYVAPPLFDENFMPQPIAALVVEAARVEQADEAAPRRTGEARRSVFEPWLGLTPGRMWPQLEGMIAEAPTKPEHPEWAELVASLRQDLERRRNEVPSAWVPAVAAAPLEAGDARGNRPMNKQKHHARKSRAIQDEWGFFDPEQCGFSALLAKLEEITDAPGESDIRPPS